MKTPKIFQILTPILLIFTTGCDFFDSSNLSNEGIKNKINIEVRISESLENKIAQKEIKDLSDKITINNNEILIPYLSFKRLDCSDIKKPILESSIQIKFNTLDETTLEIAGLKCDLELWDETYSNFFNSDYTNDSSYSKSIKIFTLENGNIFHKELFPSSPLLENEFIVNLNKPSNSELKEFSSAAELMNHLGSLNLTFNSKIIVYYLGGKSMNSFIDTDGDGVTDDKDKCREIKGSINCEGCVCPSNDNDNDGVLNNEDKCPTNAGPKDNNGCPWPDKDKDGLPDKSDKCPDKYGKCNGCECPSNDRDADKVINSNDKCPDEAGPASNGGCPLKPEITHINSEGKFYFKNVDFQKQTIEMTIKLLDGTSKIVYPQTRSYPNDGEYAYLTRELSQAAGISVNVKVTDKATKALITQITKSNLSLVCLKPEPGSPKKCGFMDTDL